MQSFVVTLLTCSITMSALALLYMAVTPFLARHYSEKGRYYAWLVIVAGLIIPFRPQWGNAIVKVDMPGEMAAPVIRIGNGMPVPIPVPDVHTGVASAFPSISLWQAAAVIWLTGMVVFLAYHVIKHYRFEKMAARWSEGIADKQILALLQSLKAETGISKEIRLYRCLSIDSPMMVGFVKPRILLPRTDLARDELRFILKHEIVHYKRKDLYYKCLVLFATAIHWFNPIVYLMAKAIGVGCELSCDAETMQGEDAGTRQNYSETILGVARYQSKLRTALSTDFYGGKKGMKKRIASILDTTQKRMGIAILCGAILLTLGTAMVFASNTGEGGTEADTGSFRAGDTVAVQVIADVTDLLMYEFTLPYDESTLKPKSVHSAIDIMWAGCSPIDGSLYVSSIRSYDQESGERLSGEISGEDMLLCEFVMEVLRDGPVEDLSIQNLYVWDSAENPVESPSGWEVKVVPLSEERRLFFEGQDTNLFEDNKDPETGLPEMTYLETSFRANFREPGYLNGEYAGELCLQVDKQEVSPGESFWVDVSLSEPAECMTGDVMFWFNMDELAFQGFEGDANVHPFIQSVDAEAGMVCIDFLPLEENGDQIERFGRFQFMVLEDPQLSGRQASMQIVSNYDNNDKSAFVIRSQSGEISLPIR